MTGTDPIHRAVQPGRSNDKSLRYAMQSAESVSIMARIRAAKRESLNLRIKPEERGLIDRAARSVGKNRTDFVLEAARRAAEEALLDRTLLTVSPKVYAEFVARLDAPPRPNERLRRTMRTKAPWE
jgi:uncharacterized protein (DUF1778 family)